MNTRHVALLKVSDLPLKVSTRRELLLLGLTHGSQVADVVANAPQVVEHYLSPEAYADVRAMLDGTR